MDTSFPTRGSRGFLPIEMLRNQNGERILLDKTETTIHEPLQLLNEYAQKHLFKIEFLDIGKTMNTLSFCWNNILSRTFHLRSLPMPSPSAYFTSISCPRTRCHGPGLSCRSCSECSTIFEDYGNRKRINQSVS